MHFFIIIIALNFFFFNLSSRPIDTVIVEQSAFKNLVPGIYTCITQNNLIEFGLRWNQRGFKETFILCSKSFCTELLLRSRFDTVAQMKDLATGLLFNKVYTITANRATFGFHFEFLLFKWR